MEITPHTGVHRCQFHVTRQAQVVSGGQGLQLGLTAGSASTWAEVTRPKVAFVSSAATAPLSRAASSFRRCRHSVAALLSACSQLNICRPPCGPMAPLSLSRALCLWLPREGYLRLCLFLSLQEMLKLGPQWGGKEGGGSGRTRAHPASYAGSRTGFTPTGVSNHHRPPALGKPAPPEEAGSASHNPARISPSSQHSGILGCCSCFP